MRYSEIFNLCPALDGRTDILDQAYRSSLKGIRLQPLCALCTTTGETYIDVCASPVNLRVKVGEEEQVRSVLIKEVIDVVTEERLTDIPSHSGIANTGIDIKLIYGDTISGSVYFANNTIITQDDATFLMLFYAIPEPWEEDDGDYSIPNHFAMITIAKAQAILAQESNSVDMCSRYEAVVAQLTNLYNNNIIEFLPSSHTSGFKLNAYSI